MPNLFADIPTTLADEWMETLVEGGTFRIERIVSRGQASPEGFWYDQDQHEWVVVLSGAARLRFADERELCELKAGDYLHLAAHRKHRVEWTTPDEPTVWLAVFYGP